MSSIFDLSRKPAIVMRSSQSVGFALAEGLAQNGVAIVVNGCSFGASKLCSVKAGLAGRSRPCRPFFRTFLRKYVDCGFTACI